MTVWVVQTRPGSPNGDGNAIGYPTREEAERAVAEKRWLRDNSRVYAPFKAASIDWKIDESFGAAHDPECTACEHDCPWTRVPAPLGAPFCTVCDDHHEASDDGDDGRTCVNCDSPNMFTSTHCRYCHARG